MSSRLLEVRLLWIPLICVLVLIGVLVFISANKSGSSVQDGSDQTVDTSFCITYTQSTIVVENCTVTKLGEESDVVECWQTYEDNNNFEFRSSITNQAICILSIAVLVKFAATSTDRRSLSCEVPISNDNTVNHDKYGIAVQVGMVGWV